MSAIVQSPGGPFASGSTPIYTAQILDAGGNGIPGELLSTLTLSIVDTMTGQVVNGCNAVNILNTGRGTVDVEGNLTIMLLAADTSMDDVPGAAQVQRSLVIDFSYEGGDLKGRHQVNFVLLALAGS